MNGPLEGTRGVVLSRAPAAAAAAGLLAGLGAEVERADDVPAGAHFAIVDAAAVEGAPSNDPALVTLVLGDGAEGGVVAIEAVAAVVTGLRHRERTLAGQRIDLAPAEALAAASGEALMAARMVGAPAPPRASPVQAPDAAAAGFPARFSRTPAGGTS